MRVIKNIWECVKEVWGRKHHCLLMFPFQSLPFQKVFRKVIREIVHRYFAYIKNKYRSTNSCPNLQCSSILHKMVLY